MVKYSDEVPTPDFDGDFDDQMQSQAILCYRMGVDRVVEYVESINAYPKLIVELKWAIEQGLI